MSTAIDASAFRRTAGLFATGVTVVTTHSEGTLHAMTANAFCSVSLDPLLVLVCIDVQTRMHTLLPRSGSFAVTVLSAEQERLARWFASSARPLGEAQFDGVPWQPAPGSGAPVLTRGLAYLDCRVTDVHPGGDHAVVLGAVMAMGELEGVEPLVWYRGGYRRLSPDLHRP